MRAWAAGLVVLFISEYVQVTYFYGTFESVERLESFGGRLLLVHLPNAVCVALAAWIAGRLHREPFRDSVPWHLAAVFGVPLFAQAVNVGVHWGRASLEGFVMSCAVVVVGAVTGYAVERLQEGER